MSVQGNWSGPATVQDIELYYDSSMGPLNDNLKLPNTDTPIQKIELLEIRADSAVPLRVLSLGFKNKRSGSRSSTFAGRTLSSVYQISNFDNTIYGNTYVEPLQLYRSMSMAQKSSSSEFRLDVKSHPTDATITPSLFFVRLRVTRFTSTDIEMDHKFEPSILMV